MEEKTKHMAGYQYIELSLKLVRAEYNFAADLPSTVLDKEPEDQYPLLVYQVVSPDQLERQYSMGAYFHKNGIMGSNDLVERDGTLGIDGGMFPDGNYPEKVSVRIEISAQ